MKKISIIFIVMAVFTTSFFSCQKENNFTEEDINLDNPPIVWKVLKKENSDLLSNNVNSIKHQESTGLIWFLTNEGLQSFNGTSFTNYNALVNVSEIYWASEETLIYKKDASYRLFNTTTQKISSVTEVDWNKAKHGIDFSYGTNNEKKFIIKDGNNIKEYDFNAMIFDKINEIPLNFSIEEVIEIQRDTTVIFIVNNEKEMELYNSLCNTDSWLTSFDKCPYEIGDTIFSQSKALLSNGNLIDFSLNEFNENPTALKIAKYDLGTLSTFNEIGFDSSKWGDVRCWVYPSNEICSDNLDFTYKQAAVDKHKTIYLIFDDHLVIYKNDTFKAIPFDLIKYNFLLRDGEVLLTNKNTLLRIENASSIQNLYTSEVDCWVFGNEELQSFTKIEDVLWIANCENIVRCQQNNCEKKRVEHPDNNFFELRSNAIEVINDSLIWIGYNDNGAQLVEWNDL